MGFFELAEVLGNVGEFLGSVAVLVTLVYLAVQVRHSRTLLEENRKIALSQVHATKTDIAMRQEEVMMDDVSPTSSRKTRAVVQAGMAEGKSQAEAFTLAVEGLSLAERLQLTSYNQLQAWHFDNMAYQAELDLLNEDSLLAIQSMSNWSFMRHRWEVLNCNVSNRVRRAAGMAPISAERGSPGDAVLRT